MKQITHTIGGKDVTLDVGKMWFSKFYGEATSSDPLLMSELLSKPDKQFDGTMLPVFHPLEGFELYAVNH